MTISIKEMREQAAVKATEARAELDKVTDKMSDAEVKEHEARFDAAMSDYDKLMKNAESQERLAAAEKEIQERNKKGVHGNPNSGETGEARGEHTTEGTSYREAFHEMMKAGGDVSELSSEVRKVLRAGAVDIRAQSVGTNTAGGFTVPVELQNVLIETMKAHGPMYDGSITTEMLTGGGNKLTMPTIDDTANTADPKAENAPIVDDGSGDAVFGQKELDAYVRSTPFIKWSMELSQDSIFNMESLLNSLIGKRLGRLANSELTIGTGVGEANGIVTASSLGITAAATAAITGDELFDLEHSVEPAYRGLASFMMNDTTLATVRKLKDGQGNYLWQRGNVIDGTPETFNGRRVVVNQAMPDLATGLRPIVFGDMSQYYVRKVGAPILGVMRERFWPDLGIAGLIRFDGELADNAAVKHLVMA